MIYPSIRIEGAILSPDILESLHDDIVGQRPADFGLEANVKVKDEIARAWADAQDYWRIFKRKAASGERRVAGGEYQAARFSPLTTETRNLWMAPLLGLLGYQLEYQAKAAELNGKTYAISHRVVNRANTPVHIVGYNDPAGLDSRAGGNQPTGARPTDSPFAAPRSPKMSAHGLVQEYLNLHDELFGLVTNGRVLRLLRDSSRLIKLTYLEFDLDRIFTDGLFADFAVLYRLLHASRLPASSEWRTASSEEKDRSPLATRHSLEACWLERYHQDSIEQGSRIREGLRAAVTEALGILGTGFLNHPDNVELNSRVWSGQLRPEAYFNHLLRLIYRLLFVMVIEERGLVFPVGASFQFVQLYFTHYSVQRLRKLAVTRGLKIQRYYDAWLSLLSTFQLFERPEQAEKIGMTALGGQLFHPESLGPLAACRLSNADLLGALERLCYFDDPKTGQRTPVNFGALATEEFGSVYESLLELHPVIEASGGRSERGAASSERIWASRENRDLPLTAHHSPLTPSPLTIRRYPFAARFFFKQAAGNERKTSGSYYTPSSLVNCLLDSALNPVIEERVANSEQRAENVDCLSIEEKHYAYQILSGSRSLAEINELGGNGLRTDEAISQRGAFRDGLSDSAGGIINSGEHSGGVGARFDSGIPAVSSHRTWKPAGTGNPPVTFPSGQSGISGSNSPSNGNLSNSWSPTDLPSTKPCSKVSGERRAVIGKELFQLQPSAQFSEASFLNLWASTPLAVRRSLLAAKALLTLKVCDPACGSGHFLIAAAQRIARSLAVLRANGEEPSPDLLRHALRQVISHCIYGVDINPMSVELCKLGLWLEAVEPGKPLTFLDHHIKCGNSLLGANPEAIEEGIPDEAYKPITGDDKEAAKWMRKLNQNAKRGQGDLHDLFDADPWERLGNLPAAVAKLEGLDDDTPEALAAKEKLYQDIIEGEGYDHARLLHDAWCAAFVWVKAKIEPGTDLTTKHLREIEANPHQVSPWRKRTIRELAGQYRFFHWHLEFPTVFDTDGNGGFDCLLGNPPWEHTELKEKEFFAERCPEIANASTGAKRKALILQLQTEMPWLWAEFTNESRHHEGNTHFLGNSSLYPLCGRGRINLYAVFAEQARLRLAKRGYMGMVLPSGIATDDTTKFYFQNVVETESLVSLFDFENRKGLFPAVDSRMKFCLFTTGSGHSLPAGRKPGDAAEFVFFAHSVDDLNDTDSRFSLSAEDIVLLNPNTRTCPIFRSRRDAELTKAIYRRVPVLIREGKDPHNPWGIRFKQGLFNMSNDSHLFRTREQLEADGWHLAGNVFERDGEQYLPLYEAKMTNQFDHRAADVVISETAMVRQGQSDTFDLADHKNPNRLPIPRYWVMTTVVSDILGLVTHPKALLSFTDVTSPTNERTMIATILPFSGVGHTKPLIFPTENWALTSILQANFNSFIFDYISRQKLGGIHFTYFNLRQLPVLPPTTYAQPCLWMAGLENTTPFATRYSPFAAFILPRVLELTYTAWDLEAFARDCLGDFQKLSPPFEKGGQGGFNVGTIAEAGKESPLTPLLQRGEPENGFAAYWRLYSPHSPLATDRSPFPPHSPLAANRSPLPPLSPLATDRSPISPPPFRWDEERRFLLRCELDAAFFHLYLGLNSEWSMADGKADEPFTARRSPFATPRDDVDYIMETFPIVKRRDVAAHGEYRTKRVILEIYDAMRLAMDTGEPYPTLLDPPPADPRCCHPPRNGT